MSRASFAKRNVETDYDVAGVARLREFFRRHFAGQKTKTLAPELSSVSVWACPGGTNKWQLPKMID